MKCGIDASVAAISLAPEAESVQADTLLEHELLVPDLFFPEVANILWKKQARGEMPPAVAEAAARWLLQVPLQVHECAAFMQEALGLSTRLNQPAYDCFNLALASFAQCPLLTADRRLFERLQRTDATDLSCHAVLLSDLDLSADR